MGFPATFTELGSALWKPLRWLILALFAAVLLELVTNATLERLNLSPPSAQRRGECNDCVVYLGRVDRLLAETVSQHAADYVATQAIEELRKHATGPTNPFDTPKRKSIGKTVMNTACRGLPNAKHCVQTLQKHKAKVLALMMSTDAVIRYHVQTAAISQLLEVADPLAPHAYVSSELHAAVDQASVRNLCSGLCQPATLLDLILPPRIMADPSMEPIIALFGELWGMVIVVTVVGSLLVAILHIRASAARRHHQLYVRLASQFRNRVTPAGEHPRPPAVAGGGSAQLPPMAPQATNSKSIAKGT
jgi:hypothetical protein